MKCSETHINEELKCMERARHSLAGKLKKTLDELNGWVTSL